MSGWSNNLGYVAFNDIIEHMHGRGQNVPSIPTHLSIEGSSYVLGSTMREFFANRWQSLTGIDLRPFKGEGADNTYLNRILGDPVARYHKRRAARLEFLETARFSYGKL